MKRLFFLLVLAFFALSACSWQGGALTGEPSCAWMAAQKPALRVADRELKKSKDYKASDLYGRAHHIIYGDEAPLGPSGRVRIAVIINGDEGVVVEDRVKNKVYAHLRQKFPRENFAVMKGTDVNTKLLQYAEEVYYNQRETVTTGTSNHRYSGMGIWGWDAYVWGNRQNTVNESRDQLKPSKVDVDGMPIGHQPRGLADMRREDYVRAGEECGYDYVFAITLSKGEAQQYAHNVLLYRSTTNHQNIWLRARFVDVASGDYLYRNDIVAEGKTHNGFLNGRVMERAVDKLMTEAMNDIAIQ